MSDLFDRFADDLLGREGGAKYTNRPADRGGPTKYGVTAKKLGEYRRLGRDATAAEVQALTETEARQLYRREFFEGPGFDRVAAVSARIAEEMLDTGVNMGPHWPSLWLQRSLNLCNRQGKDWSDLPLTGTVGNLTVEALKALLRLRGQRAGEDLVLKCLNGFQFGRYVDIIEGSGPNGDQEQNAVGWISQRIGFPA